MQDLYALLATKLLNQDFTVQGLVKSFKNYTGSRGDISTKYIIHGYYLSWCWVMLSDILVKISVLLISFAFHENYLHGGWRAGHNFPFREHLVSSLIISVIYAGFFHYYVVITVLPNLFRQMGFGLFLGIIVFHW